MMPQKVFLVRLFCLENGRGGREFRIVEVGLNTLWFTDQAENGILHREGEGKTTWFFPTFLNIFWLALIRCRKMHHHRHFHVNVAAAPRAPTSAYISDRCASPYTWRRIVLVYLLGKYLVVVQCDLDSLVVIAVSFLKNIWGGRKSGEYSAKIHQGHR